MKFIFEKKTSLFYVLSVVTLTTVLLLYYLNTQKTIASSTNILHTQEVIGKNNEVLIDAINIETGFRGFLLSGNENFLEPYTTSKTKAFRNIDKLMLFTKDNPKQQSYVILLKKVLTDRVFFNEKSIQAIREDALNNARKIAIIEDGKILTDKIRGLIAKINNEEVKLLEFRKIENEKENQLSQILFILLNIFIGIIFIFGFIIIRNQKEKNNKLEKITSDQKLASQYSLSLIEASLDPLVTINTQGKIMDMNQATVKITGIDRKKLIGSDFFDYFTEPQMAREVYQEVFAKGSVADSPLTLRHKEGKLTDVLFNGSVYKDEKGDILGVVIVARDIAEQKWALDLRVANKELAFQNQEKEKRANELSVANEELAYQNEEKENRAAELIVANEELAFQNIEKENRAAELVIANEELEYQNKVKEKRAADLVIANKELAFQNDEKEKRAAELAVANTELAFQNDEKEKRAAELVIANEELLYQNDEKEKRAAELIIADKELDFQNIEKEKRKIENIELEAISSTATLASQYSRSLIEASLDPLVTISAEGKITDVNNASIKVTGVEREKLIGTDFSNYFTEPKKAQEGYRQVFENGYIEDYPLTIKHINGNLVDVLYNASVYKDDNNKVLGVFAAARDITEQNKEKLKSDIANKNLEYSNDSLKLASQYSLSLIEASRDPLFTISTEGKITDTNQASARVTDVSKENLIGSDFIKYFTDCEKAKKGYEEVFSKGFVVDYPLTIKDGKLTPVLFNGSVYKDTNNNVIGAVVVARDITELKKAENELIEAKVFAELATAIAEQAQTKAETATLIAVNAVKAKQQFLSNMSHEIRTPMNAIIGFTKVVLKTDLSTKQREYLSAIKMSGDALIVLINDILDLAKVDAGKMVFEKVPFKMQQSIKAMLHVFETKVQEKNLELITQYDTSIPEVLLGDSVRLHQVILNLVSNAVKFTNKGKITVSVRLLSQDQEKVTIEFAVSDTGIGISEGKIGSIFENFQQASSNTSRLYGGTGLGLAIVKQLVEPQGGTITVKSKLNEGTCFSFILDFQKTNAAAEIDTVLMELDSENKDIKVLVVEDMALNQLLMKTLLDDFGFDRDIADNGQIAIEKLKTKSYDIILMDLQMPVMNGFEATEYIRKTLNLEIPIVALTADVTTVDVAKCKAVGMNDYISKPVDERLLYSKIIGLVKKFEKPKTDKSAINSSIKSKKCIDLDYLSLRTKSNPKLMMEMISLYLAQTPPLISAMKQSLLDKDFDLLKASMHKIIPSFSIMGISTDYEDLARKIQEYASAQQLKEGISEMVAELEDICVQACQELEIEYNIIKNTLP